MICTFFGHRDCPERIRPELKRAITELIETKGVNVFYVGNHGAFDTMALSVLKEIKHEYQHIDYAVVLAYIPADSSVADPLHTLLPDGIEAVPKRFSISYRNNWMLKHATFVISHVTVPHGGAAQYVEKAEKQGKIVINII